MSTLKAALTQLIGNEVTYTKGGNRNGWKGVLTAVESKATVTFDNGTSQEYRHDALICRENTTGYGYLKVANSKRQNYHVSGHNIPITAGSFLIVNVRTGKLIGTELTQEDAELFAQEQFDDNGLPNPVITVFAPVVTLAVQKPLVQRLTALFSKNK